MSKIHEMHNEICGALAFAAGTANRDQSTDSYTGSTHTFYAVPVPIRRQLIMLLLRTNQTVPDQQWVLLTDRLFKGQSHEEKTMGAMMLHYRPSVRNMVSLSQLSCWLELLVGWAEVDATCYNIFSAEELLAKWPEWKQFLSTCARSKNPNIQRAALVLLCGPVSNTTDQRVHAVAFSLCLELSSEKSILITKAISWLLRCQIDSNKPSVQKFIDTNSDRLPRIAVREVTRKLLTGKKNR